MRAQDQLQDLMTETGAQLLQKDIQIQNKEVELKQTREQLKSIKQSLQVMFCQE